MIESAPTVEVRACPGTHARYHVRCPELDDGKQRHQPAPALELDVDAYVRAGSPRASSFSSLRIGPVRPVLGRERVDYRITVELELRVGAHTGIRELSKVVVCVGSVWMFVGRVELEQDADVELVAWRRTVPAIAKARTNADLLLAGVLHDRGDR